MIDTSILQGKKAAYFTLGCKLNFAETSSIGDALKQQGVLTAEEGEVADICVVNTCSVTEIADRKCRQGIRRMVKGLMIESYIEDGAQKIGEGIYGKSITDPCLGWAKTEKLIHELANEVAAL